MRGTLFDGLFVDIVVGYGVDTALDDRRLQFEVLTTSPMPVIPFVSCLPLLLSVGIVFDEVKALTVFEALQGRNRSDPEPFFFRLHVRASTTSAH
jgi:hypothetical protein